MADIVVGTDLVKSYVMARGRLPVLRGASLSVRRGEMVAIMGPSGVGKSTLLHLLGGLDRPDSGRVEIDGVDLTALRETERARIRNRRIGFVFQFYHLLGDFSALDNVVLPARVGRFNGATPAEAVARGKEILGLVGLAERLHHRPDQLSGGEQQRVAIARALMNEPAVVLADEPTGNLDRDTADAIHEVLRRINRECGQAFVVATHNERLAERCDRVLRLEDGVIHDGPPSAGRVTAAATSLLKETTAESST